MSARSFGFVTMLLVLALGVGSIASAQVGTEFTYQGQLKHLSSVVVSPTDMRFSLWSLPSGGTQIGSTLDQLAVPVNTGLFTVSLDFGVSPYTSNQALWLQIDVRNPAGSGSYVPMTSRQKLTATPFSLATRGIDVDGNGRVSIPKRLSTKGSAPLGVAGAGIWVGGNDNGPLFPAGTPESGIRIFNNAIAPGASTIQGWDYGVSAARDIVINDAGGKVGIGTSLPSNSPRRDARSRHSHLQ